MKTNRSRTFLRLMGVTALLLPIAGGLGINIDRAGRDAQQSRVDQQLALAVYRQDLTATKRLLQAGANPNLRLDEKGLAALYSRASSSPRTDALSSVWGTTRRFLTREQWALVDHSVHTATPLSLAVQARNPVLIRTLLDSGADVNGPACDGTTPLFWASSPVFYQRIESDEDRRQGAAQLALLRLLIQRGADISHRDGGGCTALLRYAQAGNARAVRTLLAVGADPNILDNKGDTALNIAEQLRAYGPDPDREAVVDLLRRAGARYGVKGSAVAAKPER